MEGRKWAELNKDCLVNVFGRLGVESLLLYVPFVCKSWYKATLNPLCWQSLVFPCDLAEAGLVVKNEVGGYYTAEGLIKFIVNRSHRSATSLILPSECTKQELLYVADECPALKFLALPSDVVFDQSSIIPSLVSKWKNLEMLRLGSSFNMQNILAQISLHCKNFVGLCVTRAYIRNDMASTIVTLLPNIKYLVLRQAFLGKENLVMILQGCKELVQFDVSNCIGFECDDEILKLASHINNFKYEGSRAKDESDDEAYNGYAIDHDEDLYGPNSD